MASRKERRERALQRLEQQSRSTTTMTTMEATIRQGPLPAPDDLAEYDRLVPNGAERIFAVFEKQVDHRIALEERVITGNQRRADRGLFVGGTIGVVGLLIGGWVAVSGYEVAGAAIAGADLVSLVGTFIYGTNSRRAEREDKARVMSGRR
jgi:uncharacterized membrane protein